MKRVLSIQDISCLGKCSTTIALPVISAMGVETAILPTAVLSTHTMFENFTVKDLMDQLMPICEHWKSQGIQFDAIYTGYLGSAEEIELVKKIFEMFKTEDTLIFVDPVMADGGKLYPAFDESYIDQNASLCSYADIIVPNITEAALMTHSEYKEEYDEDYIKGMIQKLVEKGSKVVAITGVGLGENKTGVYGYDTRTNSYFSYQNDLVGASYHGTGDLFSSVSVGALVQGISMEESFKLAADYTAKTIEETLKDPKKPWYGVNFEKTIPLLVEKLKEIKTK